MSNQQLDVQKTTLEGILVIKPLTMFEDFRGHYVESYNQDAYHRAGIKMDFVQDDFSVSSRHVLRGIHGDRKTTKLISCMLGSIYVVIVNCDEASPQFRKWESFTISENNRLQILAPPNFGVSHLVMSERAIFAYKQSTYYDRASQFTYRWDDPQFKIWWPIQSPILSQRDQGI